MMNGTIRNLKHERHDELNNIKNKSNKCKVIPIKNIENKVCEQCKFYKKLYCKYGENSYTAIGCGLCQKVAENKKTGVVIKAEVKKYSKKACYLFEDR